jgi:DHA1 family bicyclomycin/chloramphenicol resistance-like MFS transporter
MESFHISEKGFGAIFALLTLGFIGGSQVNIILLRRFTSRQIFSVALTIQVCTGLIFLAGALLNWYGLAAFLVLFFVFLSCLGLTYPNAAAIALAPFSRNAGSAAALLGFIQMGVGALMSTGVGVFGTSAVIALLSGTAFVAAAINLAGKQAIAEPSAVAQDEPAQMIH